MQSNFHQIESGLLKTILVIVAMVVAFSISDAADPVAGHLVNEDGTIEETISPKVLDLIRDWVLSVTQ